MLANAMAYVYTDMLCIHEPVSTLCAAIKFTTCFLGGTFSKGPFCFLSAV